MIQARAIPGAPNMYVFLGCPHYPQNALGTVVRLDMNKPIRTEEPMTYMTPQVKILAEAGLHFLDPATGAMNHGWTAATARCSAIRVRSTRTTFLVAHKPRGTAVRMPRTATGFICSTMARRGRSRSIATRTSPAGSRCPSRPRPVPPVLRSASDPPLAEKNWRAAW